MVYVAGVRTSSCSTRVPRVRYATHWNDPISQESSAMKSVTVDRDVSGSEMEKLLTEEET